MNLKKLTSKLLSTLMIVTLMAHVASCSDTETTDSTKFMLYYTGVTDIGPSMNFNLNAPTVKGAMPYDFAITKVTLNNEDFSGESFVIDPKTGAIAISNTAQMPVGMYRISVSCLSNGNYCEFKNAIEVNMLPAVPDGVTAEPNIIPIDFSKIATENKTSQIKTNGTHVSITGYEVIQEKGKEYFAVSKTGEISINKKFKGEIPPGIYSVSLKLTTNAGNCIYENAVTFNIYSSPLGLAYAPNLGNVEKNYAFESSKPTIKGSLEDLKYSIKSITPATDKIKINQETGVLTVAQDNNLPIGTKYVIDVTATNKYGTKDFTGVYNLTVVDFIAPIKNFAYSNHESIQNTPFEFAPNDGFVGGMVTFAFAEVPEAISGQLAINAQTGAISAKKGNTMPLGAYPIKVKASNVKGDQFASFTLTITKNDNLFTYIRYGNNIGLSPEKDYANQYRVRTEAELHALKIKPTTDINPSATVEWTVNPKFKMAGVAIHPQTGELNFDLVAWREKDKSLVPGGIIIVNATVGKGTSAEFTLSVPVFFDFNIPIEDSKFQSTGVTVEYNPFVIQINPVKGGSSTEPVISGIASSNLSMDFCRSYNYFGFDSDERDGAPKLNTSLLFKLWERYYADLNKPNNTGAKDPTSYYSNSGSNLNRAIAYVDNSNFKVIVNPNKFVADNKPANGVMVGQTVIETAPNKNPDKKNAGSQMFFLWFDTKF